MEPLRSGKFEFSQLPMECLGANATIKELRLWLDPVLRSGPEAMAVDEWLLGMKFELPVLRVYGWHGEWGTVGYFGSLTSAKESLPGLNWVRRWTGGGTVDHREDWTYSLAVPAGHWLAGMKGALSYAWIHEKLAKSLRFEGLCSQLSSGSNGSASSLCFQNPVEHDLVAESGNKLAGAGQRRSREGFLHQGSVTGRCSPVRSNARARGLAEELSQNWEQVFLDPPPARLSDLITKRYGNPDWNARR